ncbi:MAG: DUF2147 domain-containing protein [Acidocella sp.]|nr:DUF2147 domain-containing protein [Acidocella sp.]MDR3717620.1 DUF2147 domain-containing protein [Bryobacteraceae bacterium]
MSSRWFSALWLSGGLALAQAAAASPTITYPSGSWVTDNSGTVISVAQCGADLCGRISGMVLDHPTDPPPLDWRGQLQCRDIIFQVSPHPHDDGSITWAGTVTDPRNGAVYQATVGFDAKNNLLMRGYVGLRIFGETQVWRPYAQPTPSDCLMRPAS